MVFDAEWAVFHGGGIPYSPRALGHPIAHLSQHTPMTARALSVLCVLLLASVAFALRSASPPPLVPPSLSRPRSDASVLSPHEPVLHTTRSGVPVRLRLSPELAVDERYEVRASVPASVRPLACLPVAASHTAGAHCHHALTRVPSAHIPNAAGRREAHSAYFGRRRHSGPSLPCCGRTKVTGVLGAARRCGAPRLPHYRHGEHPKRYVATTLGGRVRV